MALISKANFEKITKERNYVHEPVKATFTTFVDGDKKYFQIDTYGSDSRKMKEKISQSIQVDKDMALELIKIISKEFDIEVFYKL